MTTRVQVTVYVYCIQVWARAVEIKQWIGIGFLTFSSLKLASSEIIYSLTT